MEYILLKGKITGQNKMITDKEALEAWSKIKVLLNYLLYDAYEQLPMSQKRLADKLGISDSRLSKYRRELYSVEAMTYHTIDKFIKNYASEIFEMRKTQASNLD